jgi:hypothetical protein
VAGYRAIERALTEDVVRRALNRVVPGEVRRYAVPGLLALKFVAPTALPGGVYASLHAGLHWQRRRSGCCSTWRSRAPERPPKNNAF